MKYLLIITALLFSLQTGNNFKRSLQLNLSANSLALDNDKNLYVVEGAKVSIYYPDGELGYWYSNMYSTDIHNIDVSNPERILLFYKYDQKITILSQYFRTIETPFFLKEKGYKDVSLACTSPDDNVWIFSREEQILTKLTPNGDFITQSEKVSQVNDQAIKASYMACEGSNLYLADPDQGIFVFDPIGQYQETIPVTGFKDLRIKNGKIFYTHEDVAKVMDLTTKKEESISMPISKFNAAAIDLQGKNWVVYVARQTTVEGYINKQSKK